MANKKTHTQKRFTPKLKIKKGDMVYVVAGAYKDLETKREVLEIFPLKNRAIVENVNMRKKHQKPTQDNPGGIIDLPASIHLSNLMIADPKTGEPSRVGRKEVDGKIVRYSKKSGEII